MNKKQLESIDERILEQKTKREQLQSDIDAWAKALNDTVERFTLGEVEQSEIAEGKAMISQLENDVIEVDELITKMENVKNKSLLEYVPYVRRQRDTKRKQVQADVDEAIKAARDARTAYVKALQQVGVEREKIDTVDKDMNDIVQATGMSIEGQSSVRIPPVYPKTITAGLYASEIEESTALGLSEKTQVNAVKQGLLPSWANQ